MAHGISLVMRYITPGPPRWIHRHPKSVAIRVGDEIVGYRKPAGMTSHVNPEKDRSLPGKRRRLARKAAR